MLWRENSVDAKNKPHAESIQFDRLEARSLLLLKLIRRLLARSRRQAALVHIQIKYSGVQNVRCLARNDHDRGGDHDDLPQQRHWPF